MTPPRAPFEIWGRSLDNGRTSHCVDTCGQVTFGPFRSSSAPARIVAPLRGVSAMEMLTRAIAEFVATVDERSIPERCRFGARIGMLDCIGVMIAGAGEPASRLVAATVAPSGVNDGAPEIPSGRNLTAPDAALVNGTA